MGPLAAWMLLVFVAGSCAEAVQSCTGTPMCGAGEADLVTKTKAGITCMDWFYSGVGSSCRADAGMPPRVYTLKDVCVQDGKQYQVFQQSCSGCGRAGLGLPNCRNPAPVRGTGLQACGNIAKCDMRTALTKTGSSCLTAKFNTVGSECTADGTMPPMIFTLKSTCLLDGKEHRVFAQHCSGCGRAGLNQPDCRG